MDGGPARSPESRLAGKGSASLTAAILERRLQVRKRAREDAARGLPGVDADALSTCEHAILAAVAAERARIDELRDLAGAEAERRMRMLAPGPQDFTGPVQDARLALKQAAGRVAQDWADAARRAAEAREELQGFKQRQGLRRPASYPQSALLQAGLLLLAAVFESLFSAALFAEDDARGLLGGAITAIGLSGANVTLGFLAGFLGLRYLQHTRLPVKAIGALGFCGIGFLGLMLNLFAADWRDRLATQAGQPPDTGGDASFHLWSLLQLSSPQAIILLMLGAGVWVFAALKGYSGFDDPYPEFGKMDRAAEAAADALANVRDEARAAFEAPIEAARTAFKARLEKINSEFAAMNKAFDAAATRLQVLDAQARALDEAADGAIQIYRSENRAARTSPAPAYFDAPPPALHPRDPLAGCARLIDEARQRVRDAQTQASEGLDLLVNELEAAALRLDGGDDA